MEICLKYVIISSIILFIIFGVLIYYIYKLSKNKNCNVLIFKLLKDISDRIPNNNIIEEQQIVPKSSFQKVKRELHPMKLEDI